jgi:hypothetical protein
VVVEVSDLLSCNCGRPGRRFLNRGSHRTYAPDRFDVPPTTPIHLGTFSLVADTKIYVSSKSTDIHNNATWQCIEIQGKRHQSTGDKHIELHCPSGAVLTLREAVLLKRELNRIIKETYKYNRII